MPTPDYLADEEFALFEDSVKRFLDRHAGPDDVAKWRANGIVPRSAWEKAAKAGLLCLSTSTDYGAAGGDFRHEVTLMRELSRRGIEGWDINLHNAIVAPYIESFGTEEQKRRWLPRMASGKLIGAIAMTEPSTGSDLQSVRTTARRDGDGYVLNGSKTFITNGQNANLIVVVAKTDPALGAKGISLVCVETDGADGFKRGRNLDKIGRELADTSELFFDGVRVPANNLLGGDEGRGFFQLMEKLPQERIMIAIQSVAQFKLAEMKTEATITQVFVDHCTGLHLKGKLDSATASMAKYWITDLHCMIVDQCLQLHGGYGYMNEYPIAQAYKNARVTRIYGGTSEIMKILIARTL